MIRTLRPDEPVPSSEPRRYIDGRGYVRLRWRVGTETYVEEYEHRLVMGRPDGEVHHVNGDKADNRPDNLAVLGKSEHAHHHARRRSPGEPKPRERRRAEARAIRELRWVDMAAAYVAGASTNECARSYGIDASNVSRGLRKRGVAMRPSGRR